MKKLILLAFLFPVFSGISQVAWITPFPAVFTQPVTIYIDVNQTGSNEYNALKAILTAHPEELSNVHAWIWQPSDPVVGNGSWSDSNEELKLTWESDLLFSLTFTPMTLFNSTSANFNEMGISLLAKLDDGMAYQGAYPGEAKTEDLHIDVALPAAISTFGNETGISVYPNPFAQDFIVQSEMNEEVYEITIQNSGGQIVYSGTAQGMGNRIFINLSQLPAGLYLMTCKTDDHILRRPLIKNG